MQLRRQALIQELAQIDKYSTDKYDSLSQIPPSIAVHEDNKKYLARQARRLGRSLRPIPRSAADDRKGIEVVDSIRLHAIDVIQSFLGSV